MERDTSFLEHLETLWPLVLLLLLAVGVAELYWIGSSARSLRVTTTAPATGAADADALVGRRLMAPLLASSGLKPEEIATVAWQAAKRLREEQAADSTGEKITAFLDAVVAGGRTRAAAPTTPPAPAASETASRVWPDVKSALQWALEHGGLSPSAAAAATEKIAAMSLEAFTSIGKGFFEEAGKTAFLFLTPGSDTRGQKGEKGDKGEPGSIGPRGPRGSVGASSASGDGASNRDDPNPVDPPAHPHLRIAFPLDGSQLDAEEFRTTNLEAIKNARDDFRSDRSHRWFLLQAYTDRAGSEAHNRGLAQRRGEAVRDALIKEGVSADLIGVAAMAVDAVPVPTWNGTEEGNNRVVLIEVR